MMKKLDESLSILCSLDSKERKFPDVEFIFKKILGSEFYFYAIDAGNIDSLISKLNFALERIETTHSNVVHSVLMRTVSP